jgi:hypothetical protein
VSATGLVTAVTAGTATISASMNGFTGLVSGSVTVTVSSSSGNGSGNGTSGTVTGLQSLTILPSSISIANLQGTGEFLAIAQYTDGTVNDVTDLVTWISDAPNVFPISTNGTGAASSGTTPGIVTAYGSGNVVIIAELTDPKTGSIGNTTASFACPYAAPSYTIDPITGSLVLTDVGSCNGDTIATPLLETLTVYDAGLNTTAWLVTAASATGTPNVIHCGPGSQAANLGAPVCTATYPVLTVTPAGTPGVLLKATGAAFGGWSYNCQPSDSQGNILKVGPYYTAAGPNYCVAPLTVVVEDPVTHVTFTEYPNVTIGAIFN